MTREVLYTVWAMRYILFQIREPQIFKKFVKQLAAEKGRKRDYELYAKIERLAPEVIAQERRIYKGVSANVDFYSGFVYEHAGTASGTFILLCLPLPVS